MKLRLLQALIITFVLACGFTAGYNWPHRAIQEDDPEWDCRTMGNGICGEPATEARPRGVVHHVIEHKGHFDAVLTRGEAVTISEFDSLEQLRTWAQQQGYAVIEDDSRAITAYVEDCTLADAHAGRCTIPCGGDLDCVEKNGSRDAY